MEEEKATKQKRLSFWQYNKTTAETIKLINAREVDKSKPMHREGKQRKRVMSTEGKKGGHKLGRP